MATTYTRAQLIEQTLRALGVLASGQTSSGEDVDRVDVQVDAVVSELTARDIIYVDDVGSSGPSGGVIDAAVFLSLADVIADRVSGTFGMGDDPALPAKAREAEGRLKTVARPARARRTLRTDAQLRGTRRLYGGGSFTRGT